MDLVMSMWWWGEVVFFLKFSDQNRCVPGNTNYVNGGCISGSNCDPTTRKCSGYTSGADCSNDDELCPYHQYCDEDSETCVARKAENAACNAHYEYVVKTFSFQSLMSVERCDETLICTDHDSGSQSTCQRPFTQTAGQPCASRYDCAEGLGCDDNECREAPTKYDQDCSTNADVCDDFFANCECSQKTKGRNTTVELPAKCKRIDSRVNTKSFINAYRGMQSCLKNRNCHDYWTSRQVLDLETGPNQCIRSCLRDAFTTGFEVDDAKYNTCASSGILPGGLALLLCVFIAYMFVQGVV